MAQKANKLNLFAQTGQKASPGLYLAGISPASKIIITINKRIQARKIALPQLMSLTFFLLNNSIVNNIPSFSRIVNDRNYDL